MALRDFPSTQVGVEAPPSLCQPGLHRYVLQDKRAAATQGRKNRLILTKGSVEQRHLCQARDAGTKGSYSPQ